MPIMGIGVISCTISKQPIDIVGEWNYNLLN